MKLILSIIFTLYVASAVGEVIKHVECRDVEIHFRELKQLALNVGNSKINKSQIHAVRITPCPQAADGITNPCHIKRGRSATVEFDYTADFDATNGKGEIFWVSPEGDLPFQGMDQNACNYTECPIKKSERRTYTQKFDTQRKYPARIFDLR